MAHADLLLGYGSGYYVRGKKIIKSVGMDMVKLEKYQGFSADIAGSLCLLLSSVFGIPMSTTHGKNHCHHGGWRCQEVIRHQFKCGEGDGSDLAFDFSRLWTDKFYYG